MSKTVNKKTKPSEKLKRAIHSRRAAKGWSEQDLANAIGRARNTVNRAINHGENSTTLSLILKKLNIKTS